MNAKPAALTARAAKRRDRHEGQLLLFFQAEITLEKRRKEENKMTERQHATWGELRRSGIAEVAVHESWRECPSGQYGPT
jgi:hypothetical protein